MFIKSKAISVSLMAFFFSFNAFSCSALAKAEESINADRSSRVYYTTGDEHGAPLIEAKESFDCTDKIFTVLEIDNYEVGEHHLSVKWIDPAGRQREHTQYPFHVRGSHQHRLWAWLSLSRAAGAGMLTFINPAAGLEEFIGEWTIEVRISGKLVDSDNMAVIC